MSDSLVTAVVFFDSVGWRDADGQTLYSEEGKGSTIEIPQAEYDRLEALGAVGPEGSSVPQPGVVSVVTPTSPETANPEATDPGNDASAANRPNATVEVVGSTGTPTTPGTADLSDEEKRVYKSGSVAELTKVAAESYPDIVVESTDSKKDLARKLTAAGYTGSSTPS